MGSCFEETGSSYVNIVDMSLNMSLIKTAGRVCVLFSPTHEARRPCMELSLNMMPGTHASTWVK